MRQAAAGWSPTAGLLLCKDSLQADGSFLLACSMRAAHSASHKVVLVACLHPASHYQAALRKLGMNMNLLIQQGRMAFLEAPAAEPGSLRALYAQTLITLQRMQQQCQETILLCIDALTELRLLEEQQTVWLQFLLQLRGLAYLTEPGVCIMALVHEDIDDDAQWIALLQHSAEAMWQVRALESGNTPNVTGQVVFAAHRSGQQPGLGALPAADAMHVRTFNYKLSDNGVQLTELY